MAYVFEGFYWVTYIAETEWQDSNALELFTDRTGSIQLGCGAYFHGKCFFLPWPSHEKD